MDGKVAGTFIYLPYPREVVRTCCANQECADLLMDRCVGNAEWYGLRHSPREIVTRDWGCPRYTASWLLGAKSHAAVVLLEWTVGGARGTLAFARKHGNSRSARGEPWLVDGKRQSSTDPG